jgi:hypothetical protein
MISSSSASHPTPFPLVSPAFDFLFPCMKECVTTLSSSGKYSRVASCIHHHTSSETHMVQSALGSPVQLQAFFAFVPPHSAFFLYFSPNGLCCTLAYMAFLMTLDGSDSFPCGAIRLLIVLVLVAEVSREPSPFPALCFPTNLLFIHIYFPLYFALIFISNCTCVVMGLLSQEHSEQNE